MNENVCISTPLTTPFIPNLHHICLHILWLSIDTSYSNTHTFVLNGVITSVNKTIDKNNRSFYVSNKICTTVC